LVTTERLLFKMKKIKKTNGQALVTLLFFIIIAITITAATTTLVIANSQGTTAIEQSQIAYYCAEAGIENALLRLLRNPGYTGETLNIGNAQVLLTVTGTTTRIITSKASLSGFIRTIRVSADYSNNKFTISSWKEVYL
jgi:type II secretory pathway component PulK